ncbi:MAG: LPXTG cell wall anchor domain-containing protein [Crenarchaeota archaeon]|nr:LPXTG cell wall anchor domain-containing protein [Thermoproteota archaeon]
MKYKTELLLLLTAVIMFIISALFYSHTLSTEAVTFDSAITYPYRTYTIPFIIFGTLLMGTASILFKKKNKKPSSIQAF